MFVNQTVSVEYIRVHGEVSAEGQAARASEAARTCPVHLDEHVYVYCTCTCVQRVRRAAGARAAARGAAAAEGGEQRGPQARALPEPVPHAQVRGVQGCHAITMPSHHTHTRTVHELHLNVTVVVVNTAQITRL